MASFMICANCSLLEATFLIRITCLWVINPSVQFLRRVYAEVWYCECMEAMCGRIRLSEPWRVDR